MRELLKKLEEVVENMTESRPYDSVIEGTFSDYMDEIIKNANDAKSKLGDPLMVGLHVAEIVSKCVVILSFMYQSTKKSTKLKAVTGRLDKLPTEIRNAVRETGFDKLK